MNNNVPVKQHYIPQFILKNFCFKNDLVNYFDVEENIFKIMSTRDIFMVKNLYNDNTNHSLFPQKIEIDLSGFESEVAIIINKKFLKENSFKLSKEEDNKLKLFFALMSFRNINTKEQFANYSEESKDFFLKYQTDLNFLDFWKRNLGYLVNCRSLDEVIKHKKIDEPIKVFMMRDVFNFSGKYFLLFEKRGLNSFVIGDCYPTEITGDNSIHLYSYYPISPDRLILVVSNGVEFVPNGVLNLSKKDLKKPSNESIINVRKLYDINVNEINEHIIKNSKIIKEGICS